MFNLSAKSFIVGGVSLLSGYLVIDHAVDSFFDKKDAGNDIAQDIVSTIDKEDDYWNSILQDYKEFGDKVVANSNQWIERGNTRAVEYVNKVQDELLIEF